MMADAAIIVRGTGEHNLRSVDFTVRHNKLSVFAGSNVWHCFLYE